MWSGIHRLADRKKLTVQDLYGENLLLMHRNCKKVSFGTIESAITRLQPCCNLKVYTDEPIETSAEVSFYLYCRKGGKAQKQEAEKGVYI